MAKSGPDLDSIFGTTLTDKFLTDAGLDAVLGNVTSDDLYPCVGRPHRQGEGDLDIGHGRHASSSPNTIFW